MSDCVFCKIIRREIPSTVLHESEAVLAFEDINGQAPLHVLVVPRRHIASVDRCLPEDAELIGMLVLTANNIADEKGFCETGYRLVINCKKDGGQTVDHLHLHLLGGRQMSWPPG